MRIRKTLITALAVAIAIAFSPLPELNAATFVNPGSQPGADNQTHVVKMKKKKKPRQESQERKARRREASGRAARLAAAARTCTGARRAGSAGRAQQVVRGIASRLGIWRSELMLRPLF
jgi:hypothetical protein